LSRFAYEMPLTRIETTTAEMQ